MVDLDEVAVAAAVVARVGDDSVGGRVNRRAGGTGEVDPGVHRGRAPERVGANAIAAGECAGLDWLVGRNRDRAVLKGVKLLPAREQLLEGRVGLADRLERATDR